MKPVIEFSAFGIILVGFGCATQGYLDQREVFLHSAQGKGYTLHETSGKVMERETRDFYDLPDQTLYRLKEHLSTDTNAVHVIEQLLKNRERGRDKGIASTKAFTNSLQPRDRVFEYLYEKGEYWEYGTLILNNGKIVKKNLECQTVSNK